MTTHPADAPVLDITSPMLAGTTALPHAALTVGAGPLRRTDAVRPRSADPTAYRWLSPRRWRDYARLLHRLPADDRAARFHGSLADTAVDAHVARLRWPDSRILAAFEDDWLIGAVEVALFRSDGDLVAEMSVSVDPWRQGRRVGTRLMDRVLGWARNRWIGRVYMATLIGNRRLCAIGRRFGAEMAIDGEHVDLVFRLGPPDFATLATEAAQRWHEAATHWPRPDWPALPSR